MSRQEKLHVTKGNNVYFVSSKRMQFQTYRKTRNSAFLVFAFDAKIYENLKLSS